MPEEPAADSPASSNLSRQEKRESIRQAMVDNLNRAVREEHERDIEALPADVRARYSREQLDAMPRLTLLALARHEDPDSAR